MALYRHSGERSDLPDLSPGAKVPRMLSDIYKDVAALSAQQRSRVWTDITSAVVGVVPRKYLSDRGPNAAPIFVMDWTVYQSGATGAQLTAAQNDLIAMYVQDNPSYLIAPPFDPTINVPGSEVPP